jgi:hypothetical protein
MAIPGCFGGQNSCFDSVDSPQSGFWTQVSLVGGPGGLTGCSSTYLGISLALSGPSQVLAGTPKMAIFGCFGGKNSCVDPLEGPQNGLWTSVGGPGGLWDNTGCSRTFLGISLALSGPSQVLDGCPK